MKLLKISSILIFLCISFAAFAQKSKDKEEKESSIRERFVFGGSLGVQAGSVTSVYVAPMVGFYFTPRLFGGTSLTYQYYYEKWLNSEISTHIFGGSLLSEYTIIDDIGKNLPIKADFSIISHVEYEALNLDRDFSNSWANQKTARFWLHGILLGGGIKQNFGKHSSINIAILYNILWDARTPYTNPIIRLGIYL